MAYILSVSRGETPQSAASTLARVDIEAALDADQYVQLVGDKWLYEKGPLSFTIQLPTEDPGDAVSMKVRWSTSDELADILEFAVSLAQHLDARVHDHQANSQVTAERVAAIRRGGGFAAAARPRKWWQIWH